MLSAKDGILGGFASAMDLEGIEELKIAPSSLSLESMIEQFWEAGPELDEVEIDIVGPDKPLELLEQLGPSPFERGSFPLIGFLATTYDKVSRYALGDD